MAHLIYRNVNDAFCGLLRVFEDPAGRGVSARVSGSRAGAVKMMAEPMTITYIRPRERVLLNEPRDANCFFHLFEALHMLAGRNDVEPLARYNSTIGQFSDDGEILTGSAYGYRWRHHPGNDSPGRETPGGQQVDQLKIVIDHLKRKPESRRCVLQMWNVEDDLLKIDTTKDNACNTHVYFSLREIGWTGRNSWGDQPGIEIDSISYALDMTVCNRSNDLVWGCLGANVVHFSLLQEYMACCIGVEVGTYNQFTNNLHVYLGRYRPGEWLRWYDSPAGTEPYPGLGPKLVLDPETFDREVQEFIDNRDWTRNWREPFLQRVASPMFFAFDLHKQRLYDEALKVCELIEAPDWRLAATRWIQQRKAGWEAKRADE